MSEVKIMEEINLNSSQPQPKTSEQLRAVPDKTKFAKILPYFIVLVIVGLGIFTGLVLTSVQKAKAQNQQAKSIEEEELSPQQQESFAQTFRDEAEGTVEKNDDLDKYAQGTHKLLRPGGESQTAYLTSSVLDLDEYVGKKVKVFGETFGSSQVGWLMDVGKVEVQ
ncbi:hypothetical protein A3D07_02535 [Candidatus Curtissbacteria bacterium RIFCSPHIGHO2_02_FULL_42_15]|uniref:Uncharacterized protein n=2 Tax=Candidatus Curtissiibacteriota TaxID=1752717 RepID=A0A1F5GDZ1_9BACT|nr:MAG: hypothetical protein A3D07_02535 [Candidatus Curtissbacteria bacterium RIFCSPHIGHO2_02_FULL_42_15]